MKPTIYLIAILTGILASVNTASLLLVIQNMNPNHLISKAKYEIIIHQQTKSPQRTLCPTELKVEKELKFDKSLIETLLS